MLKRLNESGLHMCTYFATDITSQAHYDPGYDREITWDVPLLEGYEYEVLPLLLTKIPRWRGFRRFLKATRQVLARDTPDAVWVHGWGNAYSLAAIVAAWLDGLPIMIRGESQLGSLRGTWLWRRFHRWLLSRLFRKIDYFLAIGSANKDFYKAYGVDSEKIVEVPFAADNAFFQARIKTAVGKLGSLRASLGISEDAFVILFSGRLVREKDAGTLIRATGRLAEHLTVIAQAGLQARQRTNLVLLIVGDGELRSELESLANREAPGLVHFLGFQNQRDLPDYYALCDVMVLPSLFEPWGLVVNEVMNAGKPVIVSDRVGSAADLVSSDKNGFVFPAGDVDALCGSLEKLVLEPSTTLGAGAASLEIISRWSYEEDVAGIRDACLRLASRDNQTKKSISSTRPSSGEARVSGGISLAYLGVHEIFQMAATAAEMGRLDRFYCSLFDVHNSWGRMFRQLAPFASLSPFGAEHLPPERVTEVPLPLIAQRIAEKVVGPSRRVSPLWTNRWFQRQANKLDVNSTSSIVVGSETCALEWFLQAKSRGAKCVLDCHGIPAPFLDECRARACKEFGLPAPPPSDIPIMVSYKKREREAADVIICCSDLQRHIWAKLGEDGSKMRTVPLWVDIPFWHPIAKSKITSGGPLQVVFAGACSVSKGLPYLIKAVESLRSDVALTLVGTVEPLVARLLRESSISVSIHPYMPRPQLRQLFGEQDVLVMPSLGDSFGFVAMEAMACGLPVIVSDHCGVPVPDPAWRVPAFSSDAIVDRLRHYIDNRGDIQSHSLQAAEFAAGFSPQEYRNRLRAIFDELLPTS